MNGWRSNGLRLSRGKSRRSPKPLPITDLFADLPDPRNTEQMRGAEEKKSPRLVGTGRNLPRPSDLQQSNVLTHGGLPSFGEQVILQLSAIYPEWRMEQASSKKFTPSTACLTREAALRHRLHKSRS
jgi:hypothetical protein